MSLNDDFKDFKGPTQMTDEELVNFGEVLGRYAMVEINKNLENLDLREFIEGKLKLTDSISLDASIKKNNSPVDINSLSKEELEVVEKKFKDDVKKLAASMPFEISNHLRPIFEKYQKISLELIEKLKKQNLWLSPSVFSNLNNLALLVGSEINANDYFIKLFSDPNFQITLMKNWEKYDNFKARERFLKYVLFKFSEKDYIAVVLCGASQYEGILRERAGVSGKYVKSKVVLKKSSSNIASMVPNFLTKLIGPEVKLNFAEKEFFEQSDKVAADAFNRHQIFHGDDLSYDNEKNAIICLLLLDTVLSYEMYFPKKK